MYHCPFSAFHHSKIPPQGTWTSQLAAVYFRVPAVCTAWASEEAEYFSPFSANIHPRLVARSCKPIKCMLKILFRECKQCQIVRKMQTFHLAASDSYTLFDVAETVYPNHIRARLWRGVRTTHTLVGWLRRHGYKLLRRNTLTWWPVTGGRQHRSPATLLSKAFPEQPGGMLLRGRQNIFWTSSAYSQDFSKISCRVKAWSVVLRPGRKILWVSFSFDSIISRHHFSGNLHIFFQRG